MYKSILTPKPIDLYMTAHTHTNVLSFTKASDFEMSNHQTKSKQGPLIMGRAYSHTLRQISTGNLHLPLQEEGSWWTDDRLFACFAIMDFFFVTAAKQVISPGKQSVHREPSSCSGRWRFPVDRLFAWGDHFICCFYEQKFLGT